MNHENIKSLITLLESVDDDSFNMQYFFYTEGRMIGFKEFTKLNHVCGTTACIAGWVNVLVEMGNYHYDDDHDPYDVTDDTDVAANWLGLSKKEAQQIFYAGVNSVWARYESLIGLEDGLVSEIGTIDDWSKITRQNAIDMLNLLLEGKIHFSFDGYYKD